MEITTEAVHTELKLSERNFHLAITNKKLSTIRLGHKEITPGLSFLVNAVTGVKKLINIWYVNHCLLSDLELNDARLDGFDTMEDLKADLRECYQRPIGDREVITQVHFDVIAQEGVE